jgi:hypothetical protein
MKVLNTRNHGIVDILMILVLFAVPRVLGWEASATNLMTVLAVAVLANTLLTRFEFGLLKVWPMSVHLVMDMLVGAVLIAAPFVLGADAFDGNLVLPIILGLMEIGAAAVTEREPSYRQQAL